MRGSLLTKFVGTLHDNLLTFQNFPARPIFRMNECFDSVSVFSSVFIVL